MENKEYLSEEKYQQNNLKVKKIGKILLIVGIIMLIVGSLMTMLGFFSFGSSIFNNIGSTDVEMDNFAGSMFSKFGLFSIGSILSTIGFGLTAFGGVIMLVAHRREIAAYSTQQVMPIAKEGVEKMAPTLGIAAKEISKGIKEGLNEADKNK